MMSLKKTKADRKWAGRKQSQGKLNQSARGWEWTQVPFEVASSSSVEKHPEAFLLQMGRRIAWLAVLWPSAPGARRAPPGPGRWTLPTWEEYTHWSSALTQHNISSIESYLMQVISSVRYNTTSIQGVPKKTHFQNCVGTKFFGYFGYYEQASLKPSF